MRMKFWVWSLAILMMGVFLSFGFAAAVQEELSSEEKQYLQDLAKATYDCIRFYVDPNTGLPLDNTTPGLFFTSNTNIGLYLTSLAAAVDMGLEKKEEALLRVKQVLNALDKIEKWNNFPVNLVNVSTLQKEKKGFVSTVDLGNLYAGLIVTRQAFPEVAEHCSKFIKSADWSKLYNPKAKYLYIGYEGSKQRFTEYYYVDLGSESRTAYFLAVANGQIPLESWNGLGRGLEESSGVTYLKPGWGGGLFTQYLPGIFVNEAGSLMGKSAANFAYAQIMHAQKINSPAWGWSPSDSPGYGYIGIDQIRDEIITPHASVLAIGYFPKQVVKNLKKLEKLGVRPLQEVNGEEYDFGFRDAMNTKSGRINKNYLILDQAMLFLSLANFLDDKVVNRYYAADPLIQRGLRLIPEYKNRKIEDLKYPVDLASEIGVKTTVYTGTRPEYQAKYADTPIRIDGKLEEWKNVQPIVLDTANFEFGNLVSPQDFGATFYFLWDDNYLYFAGRITDEAIVSVYEKDKIYKDDTIELFITAHDRLSWGSPDDFQLGISPSRKDDTPRLWAWFQRGEPAAEQVKAKTTFIPDGYIIEAAISWNFLEVKPKKNFVLGISPAVHDVDTDGSLETKLNWYFKKDGGGFVLGKVTLDK